MSRFTEYRWTYRGAGQFISIDHEVAEADETGETDATPHGLLHFTTLDDYNAVRENKPDLMPITHLTDEATNTALLAAGVAVYASAGGEVDIDEIPLVGTRGRISFTKADLIELATPIRQLIASFSPAEGDDDGEVAVCLNKVQVVDDDGDLAEVANRAEGKQVSLHLGELRKFVSLVEAIEATPLDDDCLVADYTLIRGPFPKWQGKQAA